MNNLTSVVKMVYGSHLYGTDTPASDRDYKGVYIPDIKSALTGKYRKSIVENSKSTGSQQKNNADDVDCETYSLQYFIDLACHGETVAIDMIHAPNSKLVATSEIWSELVSNRSKFYTRGMMSFVGYARSQAAKYGIKGSRLSDCRRVLDYLKALPCAKARISEVWDGLPEGEHITKSQDPKQNNVKLYQVCGKVMQSTSSIERAISMLEKYYSEYGARAQLAAVNSSIDWKAMSHALRACFQVREILTTGDLKFPLKDAAYLLEVKRGMHSYKDTVGPRLEREIDELQALIAASKLPDEVDTEFWDEFILRAYRNQMDKK